MGFGNKIRFQLLCLPLPFQTRCKELSAVQHVCFCKRVCGKFVRLCLCSGAFGSGHLHCMTTHMIRDLIQVGN
jgi:hypothetical protein